MPTAPPAVDVEPADLEAAADPDALLADLRSQGEAVTTPSGFVLVLGHDATTRVLRSPVAASGPIAARYLAALPAGAARDEMVHRINFLDPPDHPRVRGIVSRAFTPRRVAAVAPFVHATARALLADLPPDDPVDLLPTYCHQLPSLVISELLGVPPEDRHRLTALSDAVAPLLGVQLTAAARAAALDAAEEMHARLGELLDERSRAPADDLLSALAHAEEDGARLSRPEVLSLAATLYSAGHRTTRDLTANGLARLLSDREATDAVRYGAVSPEALVQEMLRHATPTSYVARVTTAPIELATTVVPAGTATLVVLAAANRDSAVYDAPDDFRVERLADDPSGGPPAPLSFAFGAHHCLGAALARQEAGVMVTELLAAFPVLGLADRSRLRWHQRGPFRGLDALTVVR